MFGKGYVNARQAAGEPVAAPVRICRRLTVQRCVYGGGRGSGVVSARPHTGEGTRASPPPFELGPLIFRPPKTM